VIAALAHLDDDEPGGDLLSELNSAVHEGNAAIAAQVEADPELDGMGTTLTAILFAGNRLGLVHIGDSRGYLLREGELNQITKDDTFVQTLVDEGRITAEEAHSHPQRSLIMRALTGHEVEPTLIMREARVGDRYLLCSDGLSDPVSHETIHDALLIADVADSADRLIEMALRGGGPDNVTVVVADVVDYGVGQTQPILAGAVSGEDDQSAPPNTAAGRASAFNPKRTQQPPPPPAVVPEPVVRKPRSRRRMVFAAIVLVLLIGAGLAIGRLVIQSNYYVAEYDGAVSIMRGVQGSFLGMPLQQPFRVACLDSRNELTIIGTDDPRGDCQVLKVGDLRESERAQVKAGLPAGSVDDAIRQLKELGHSSLLPVCLPPAPTTTATPPPVVTPAPGQPGVTAAPSEAPREPTESVNPEVPTTVTSPAPESNAPAPPPPPPSPSPSPSPTATALPPPPQEPGTNCRTAS
jgi:PPM family protein phosphatase